MPLNASFLSFVLLRPVLFDCDKIERDHMKIKAQIQERYIKTGYEIPNNDPVSLITLSNRIKIQYIKIYMVGVEKDLVDGLKFLGEENIY